MKNKNKNCIVVKFFYLDSNKKIYLCNIKSKKKLKCFNDDCY